jgi:hypothetical protein
MKPKYLHSPTHQRDRWMISYVDVLSILLIFFLVAAAKEPGGSSKANAVVPVQPVIARAEAKHHSANLIRAQQRLRERGLEPKLERRGLVISLSHVILFSSGEDTRKPSSFAHDRAGCGRAA